MDSPGDPIIDLQPFCLSRSGASLFQSNAEVEGQDTIIEDDMLVVSGLFNNQSSTPDKIFQNGIGMSEIFLHKPDDVTGEVTREAESVKNDTLVLDINHIVSGDTELNIAEHDFGQIVNNDVPIQQCCFLKWNITATEFILIPLDALKQPALLDKKPDPPVSASTDLENFETKTYKCDVCGSIFDEMRVLVLHYQEVHRLFKCPICVKYFSRSYKLKEHLFVHTDRCQFVCRHCEKQFKRGKDLHQHIKRMHSLLPPDAVVFLCDSCGFQTKSKSSIRSHVLGHLNVGQFVCDICKKRCKNKGDLADHRNTHFDIKPYKCDLCSMCFCYKQTMVKHRQTQHEGLFSYVCDVCGRSFLYRHSLVLHMQLHRGENRVECEVCGKIMSGKTALINHRKIHTQERDFVCGICGKMYINKYSLQEHLLVHTGSKPFQCLLCDNSFSSRKKLLMHERIHDPCRIQYKCLYCEKSYLTKYKLKVHVSKHHPTVEGGFFD